MVVVPSAASIMRTIGVLRVVLKEIGLDPATVAKIVKAFVEQWRGRGVEIPDEEPGPMPAMEEEITWEYSVLTLARARSWRRVRPLVPKRRDENDIPNAEAKSLAAYLNRASKDGWRVASVVGGERSATIILRRPKP
jgi:hypothetical protein